MVSVQCIKKMGAHTRRRTQRGIPRNGTGKGKTVPREHGTSHQLHSSLSRDAEVRARGPHVSVTGRSSARVQRLALTWRRSGCTICSPLPVLPSPASPPPHLDSSLPNLFPFPILPPAEYTRRTVPSVQSDSTRPPSLPPYPWQRLWPRVVMKALISYLFSYFWSDSDSNTDNINHVG